MISAIFNPMASYLTQRVCGAPIPDLPDLSSLGNFAWPSSQFSGPHTRYSQMKANRRPWENHYTSRTAVQVQGEAKVDEGEFGFSPIQRNTTRLTSLDSLDSLAPTPSE